MADPTGLGRRLFQARKRREAELGKVVSQAAVGAVVGVTGVAVGSWEAGRKEPDLATIAAIAKFLHVSPGWLAFGDTTAPDESAVNDIAPEELDSGAAMDRKAARRATKRTG